MEFFKVLNNVIIEMGFVEKRQIFKMEKNQVYKNSIFKLACLSV